MPSTSSIYALLKFYASRQNSAIINHSDFLTYVKAYSQRHVEEQPELIPFLGDSDASIQKELNDLVGENLIVITEGTGSKRTIIVISFYVQKIALRYKEMENNQSLPFPVPSDLPKNTVADVMKQSSAADLFETLLSKQVLNDKTLYAVILPHDIPPILFPSSFPVQSLMNISLSKICITLKKEEYYDYFLKKLCISNPGKEITAKNFFTKFVQNCSDSIESIKESSDKFYFFSQLCFFIRKDYEKVKDMTQEDTCLLQAISIAEIIMAFYKNQSQQNVQRENALRVLKQNMRNPPYYYALQNIYKFVDSHGIPLHGQYTDEDLKNFLQHETTGDSNKELPPLLVFKVNSGKRYFIYKDKVFSLVIRLCNDAHDTIKNKITQKWYAVLKNFEKLPEMTDELPFENRLEAETYIASPVLYAILHANFLLLIQYETQETDNLSQINLFSNGKLLPYSELLMIDRQECLSNAKMLLPFWYGIPIVSWIISLFMRKPKTKKAEPSQQHSRSYIPEETREKAVSASIKHPVSRKEAIIDAAKNLELDLVPRESTLERELESYRKQWNKMITKEANQNLTDDVNMLIRDYLRKVLRTINATNFTINRIDNLAETLVKTPNMQKIKQEESLKMYVKLYMIYLIKNMK